MSECGLCQPRLPLVLLGSVVRFGLVQEGLHLCFVLMIDFV